MQGQSHEPFDAMVVDHNEVADLLLTLIIRERSR
jgi:hypothetical protein